MKVAITKKFSTDFFKVENSIKEKTKNILSNIISLDFNQIISNKSFRFHSLYNSKLKSISVNMNFRLLAILDEDTLIFHRLLNHDSAYRISIIKNYTIDFFEDFLQSNILNSPNSTKIDVKNTYFKTKINNLLLSIKNIKHLNIYSKTLKSFKDEDEFLNFIEKLNNKDSIYLLELYLFNHIDLNDFKYKLFSTDFNLNELLRDDDWKLYLHPTQKYITKIDVNEKVFVNGSAGTGKTICAIKRAQYLLNLGYKVAILVATKSLKGNIEIITLNTTYKDKLLIFTPFNIDKVFDLIDSYDHIIIDECQEFSPSWFSDILKRCDVSHTGLSVFYDLNQMFSNIKPGDTSRYNKKFKEWDRFFSLNKNIKIIKLDINYRNPVEINNYCIEKLNSILPYSVDINKSCYSTTGVVELNCLSEEEIVVHLNNLISKLLAKYEKKDIMIIDDIRLLSSSYSNYIDFSFNTSNIINHCDISFIKPLVSRGLERKVVIFLTEPFDKTLKVGKSIKKYISLSRAKEQLFVINKLK